MSNIDLNDPMIFAGVFVLGLFLVAFTTELVFGRIAASHRPRRDGLFMLVGMLSQSLLSGAFIGAIAGAVAIMVWPNSAGALSHIGFWLAFPVIFVAEEFMHYVLHRYAHEWRWLWKLHRTHHSSMDLNVGVVYRYNVFWVLILPQSWIGAFAVYFGQADAFVAAILVTFSVNVLTHSSFRWDLWLRKKLPFINPAWNVMAKVITTPDAHHAHHAYGKTGHPNGNYAITLFIFDVLLGTAKLPNTKQQHYGLPISPRLHWAEELLWPLVKKPLLPKPESAEPVASSNP